MNVKEAVFTGEVCGERGQKFFVREIKMADVLIRSYNTCVSAGDMPTESISLNFTKIEFTYTPMKEDASRRAGQGHLERKG